MKFEEYHKCIAGKRLSNIVSYFLSTIIFTKKPAKRKSYFLAFFSSFLVFETLA
jgi:hypothetical protein